jgi:type I restriction enzyme S subunit
MSKMLCDVAEIIDSLHKTPKYSEKGFPMVRVVDVNNGFLDLGNCFMVDENTCDEHNKNHIPQIGDVIITRVGSYGMLAYINTSKKFCLGQNIAIISPKANGKFLYYYLKSPFIQNIIYGNSGGSSYKCISLEKIKKLPYCDSKLNVEKIGDLLYSIDSKIENNNKINLELESMAKTIYDYWFLQFEFPNKDGKPYKSSEGKMIWNEELKREIPEGWEVGRLNQFIKQDKGGDWGKEFPEGNYIEKVTCLRGADFPAICGAAKLEAPDRFINKKNMFKTLKKGDLIIEISGGSPTQSTGRICYINTNVLNRFKNKLITSNFCKAINLIDEDFMYWFYSLWRKLYDSGVFFLYEGKTTGIKNLLFEMLCRDYPIIIPITDVIKKYNKKIEKLYDEIQQKLLENAELLSLRDFLLPLLMNGQVGFKD